MSIMYIKTLNDAICEVTNFKDVTIVIDLEQRYNYISFNIKNTEEVEIDTIEIALPFKDGCISDSTLKHNAEACSLTLHNEFIKLKYKMTNPLRKDVDFPVEIGFKITSSSLGKESIKKKLTKKELTLHIYNLCPIDESCRPQISSKNYPSICPKSMGIYVILPKSLKKDNFYPRAECPNDSDKQILKADIIRIFKDEEMLNEKKFDEVFKWTNYQLTTLVEKFFPVDTGGRIVSLEFSKNDSVQIFGYVCNRVTKISLIIAIISLISTIISLPLAIVSLILVLGGQKWKN